jgi:hypothetical protein
MKGRHYCKPNITMKKIFFFAVLAVALAGFGMHMGIAQAQTTTAVPTNNAALEQELQVAKATLINLEMQEGIVPQGDDQLSNNTAPSVAQPQPTQTTTGLSVSQTSAFENTLATLVGTLSQLNASLNANPNMSTNQIAAIETTLGGMQNTLVAMASSITADEAPSSFAMAAPVTSSPTTGESSVATAPASAPIAQAAPVVTPAAAPTTAATVTATATPVQATAQASSIWSFTKSHWPAIVIILLVIIILAILFWPENDSTETVTTMTPQKTVTTTSSKTTNATVTSSVSAAVASAPTTAPANSTKIA